MSLSDCPKCWSTPCTCGYEYENWDNSARIELIRATLKGVSHKELQDIVNDIFVIMPISDTGEIEILINGE